MQFDLTTAGYVAGWKIVRHLPPGLAGALFSAGADYAARGSQEQLRTNLARVVGPENVTRDLVRDSLRSYARYWREAFALAPSAQLSAQVARGVQGWEHFAAAYARGKGVIVALPHSGNWDMAGMFLVDNIGRFTTVAERLKPDALFRAFVEYREGLGFEVLPHTGGAKPYPRLKEVLEGGGVVCLLGERDFSHRGVIVNFLGEPASFPAGPAALAAETGASLHVAHSWYPGPEDWGLSISAPLDVTTVQETTQRIADGFARNIADHPADWHMLQPVWLADRQDQR